jgi:hypothetical protein
MDVYVWLHKTKVVMKIISEGGVGIAIECIKGGFAAITYNTTSDDLMARSLDLKGF